MFISFFLLPGVSYSFIARDERERERAKGGDERIGWRPCGWDPRQLANHPLSAPEGNGEVFYVIKLNPLIYILCYIIKSYIKK